MIETLERRMLFNDTRPYGIDVSHWQGTINWNSVYAAGKVFAFTKATEGVTYNDPTMITNMTGAKNAGVFIGPYHFARPDNNTAVAEAQHFLERAGAYMTNGYLRPVLDLETGAELYTVSEFSQWVVDFMTRIKSTTGITPIIYIGRYARQGEVNSTVTQYPMWVAHWTYDPVNTNPNTGIFPTWAFWQYADNGTVPGVSGACDLDVFNGTMNQLRNTYVIPRTAVVTSAFSYLIAPQTLEFAFNLNVSSSLSSADLVLTNTSTGQVIPPANMAISYSSTENVATFTFPGYAAGALPDGHYTATLSASGVRDFAGTSLESNYTTSFFFLRGDANHDGLVNLTDFNILAVNYGQSPRNFSQGDFNYDSVVNLADFNLLAARFGQSVNPLLAARTTLLGTNTFPQCPQHDDPLDQLWL